MSVRSRIVEDAVAEAAARGSLQYVIFGVGLDSFGLRRPSCLEHVQVFEVDHADTQSWKTQRLAEIQCPIPEGLAYVDVDFETERFEDKLISAGLQVDTPTLFSMLGVSQYISNAALEDLLKRTAALVTGRRQFVMNFIPPIETLPQASPDAVRSIATKSAVGGEPFVSFYTPEQLLGHLAAAGFSDVEHFGPDKIRHRYFSGRPDGLSTGNVLNIIKADSGAL